MNTKKPRSQKSKNARGKRRPAVVKYTKFPKTLGALSQSYEALIRELAKR